LENNIGDPWESHEEAARHEKARRDREAKRPEYRDSTETSQVPTEETYQPDNTVSNITHINTKREQNRQVR
jgi:hypothetical protein